MLLHASDCLCHLCHAPVHACIYTSHIAYVHTDTYACSDIHVLARLYGFMVNEACQVYRTVFSMIISNAIYSRVP